MRERAGCDGRKREKRGFARDSGGTRRDASGEFLKKHEKNETTFSASGIRRFFRAQDAAAGGGAKKRNRPGSPVAVGIADLLL